MRLQFATNPTQRFSDVVIAGNDAAPTMGSTCTIYQKVWTILTWVGAEVAINKGRLRLWSWKNRGERLFDAMPVIVSICKNRPRLGHYPSFGRITAQAVLGKDG